MILQNILERESFSEILAPELRNILNNVTILMDCLVFSKNSHMFKEWNQHGENFFNG